MKLSKWAKEQGITYQTAWNLFKQGKIPNAYKLGSGTIIVPEIKYITKPEYIITYARVSSAENKPNLERQSERLVKFCNANGWQVHQEIKEIGSALNDSRKKLIQFLESGKPTKIIIEHKDRLTRFGFKYIEILCKHIDCEIIIINNSENDRDDLMQDFVSVITSFCARLYGLRRCKRKTEQLIKELENK
jgi:predicted site-specific integrase-resolvase